MRQQKQLSRGFNRGIVTIGCYCSLLLTQCTIPTTSAFVPTLQQGSATTTGTTPTVMTTTQLNMQPSNRVTESDFQRKLRQGSDLSAFAVSSPDATSTWPATSATSTTATRTTTTSSSSSTTATGTIPEPSFLEGFLLPVMSAALLITGNEIGASMLVLPEIAREPGMGITTSIMVGSYLMNLISGLTLAQIAIEQHESSGSDVPSSFKEFAEVNVPSAANLVSGISIFINTLVLAFDTAKAGQVTAAITGLDGTLSLGIWATMLVGLVSTQSLQNLSQVASLLVMGLFSSLAVLLLPGLAHVADPWSVLTSSGVADSAGQGDMMASTILHMTPVILTTLVFQNIVPTVTRILDYNRMKSIVAITVGSMIPLAIYLAWCTATLGGGIDMTLGGGSTGPMMTVFSTVTVAGSSIGALMSLAEEYEIFLQQEKKDTFSLPSIVMPVGAALLVGQIFASDINDALKVAGSFGSPVLYGLIPVTMAWIQQQKKQQEQQQRVEASNTRTSTDGNSIIPGGLVGLGVLGAGASSLVGSELFESISHVTATTTGI